VNSQPQKSAIIPYRISDAGVEVLLIRNSNDDSWVIPKGNLMHPLDPEVSAAVEAYEEAGVLGRIHHFSVGKYFKNKIWIPAYMLLVEHELEEYKEKATRRRKWYPFNKLEDKLKDEVLFKVIKDGISAISKTSHYFSALIQSICEIPGIRCSSNEKRSAVLRYSLGNSKEKKVRVGLQNKVIAFRIRAKISKKTEQTEWQELKAQLLKENASVDLYNWVMIEEKGKRKVFCQLCLPVQSFTTSQVNGYLQEMITKTNELTLRMNKQTV